MTTTIVHGSLPEGIRDHHGVFATPASTDPAAKLTTARLKVAELKHDHTAAQNTLHLAVQDEGGHYDFQALKASVHSLARELAEAEEGVAQWESVCKQIAKADRERRLYEALKEARETRQKFSEFYRDACLQLGQWYRLGSELRELVNELADKMPTGHVYRPPDLTNALREVDENPNPLPALKDAGYSEIQTAASWRRHVAVVPLVAKEK